MASITALLLLIPSIAFMLVAMFAVMRSLIGVPTRNGWRVPFGGPGGFLKKVVTDPVAVVNSMRRIAEMRI